MTLILAVLAGVVGSFLYNIVTSPGAEQLREEGKKRRRRSGYER